MEKMEFEKLTGLAVSKEEFDAINNIFLMTSIAKETFCKEYLKVKDSIVVSLAVEAVKVKNYALQKKSN